MKILIILANMLILFGFLPQAYATCSGDTNVIGGSYVINPVRYTVNFGNVTVQKNAPVGTTIANAYTPYNENLYYGACKNGGYIYGNMTYGGGVPSGVEHVYKTNVPGIGIMLSRNQIYFDSPRFSYYTGASIAWSYADSSAIARLIVIGPVSPGSVEPGEIGFISFDGSPDSHAYTVTLGSPIPIVASSCSITTPSVNVKLDDIFSADLNAVGKTAKLKNFNVGLDCEASAKVNVKLTGNKNTDTSASGVLQLTNAGSAGVAKGVGIQMLYNNAPMVLDQNVLLKTSTGGTETFTFGAQYYQTKSDVSMGSANATATLDITYQ